MNLLWFLSCIKIESLEILQLYVSQIVAMTPTCSSVGVVNTESQSYKKKILGTVSDD